MLSAVSDNPLAYATGGLLALASIGRSLVWLGLVFRAKREDIPAVARALGRGGASDEGSTPSSPD